MAAPDHNRVYMWAFANGYHNAVESSAAVAPGNGRIREVLWSSDDDIGTSGGIDHTFAILVNGVDSGVAIHIPDTHTGFLELAPAFMDAKPVEFQQGDRLSLLSGAEQISAGASNCQVQFVLELDTPNLSIYPITGEPIADISTGSVESTPVIVPFVSTLAGVLINPTVVIDADLTFDLMINGADSGIDVTLADASAADAGHAGVLDGSFPELALGDTVSLQSNNEQIASSKVDITWLMRRLEGAGDLNVYSIPGRTVADISSIGESAQVVVPGGVLLGVVMNSGVLLDADNTFDVNAADGGAEYDTGVDVTLPDATAADTGIYLPMPSPVALTAGSKLRLTTNNEQTAAGACHFAYRMRH